MLKSQIQTRKSKNIFSLPTKKKKKEGGGGGGEGRKLLAS